MAGATQGDRDLAAGQLAAVDGQDWPIFAKACSVPLAAHAGGQAIFSERFTPVKAITAKSGESGKSVDPSGPQSLPQEAASCEVWSKWSARQKFRLTATFLAAILFPAVGHAGWKHSIIGKGTFLSVAVGNDGISHYLYESESAAITHLAIDPEGKRLAGETINFSALSSLSGQIVSDSNNHLHVVVWSSAVGLQYGFYDGTAWSVQDIPNSSSCAGAYLAVDSSDEPHVASFCGLPGSPGPGAAGLYHLALNGSIWSYELVVPQGGGIEPGVLPEGIFAPSDGTVHIGYMISAALCEAVKTSGSWTENCGCAGVPDYGGTSSMALDSTARPHFVYYANANGLFAGQNYCYFDGANWNTQNVSAIAFDGALSLDSFDVAQVVLLEPSRPNSMSGGPTLAAYGKLQGTTWQFQPIARAPSLTGVGMALDPLGLPHAGATVPTFPHAFAVYAFLAEPDLIATWLSIETATNRRGALIVTGNLDVTNQGTAAGRGFTAKFYLSDDATLGSSATFLGQRGVSLGVGAQKMLKFAFKPAAAVSGEYLIASISPRNPQNEANTANNTAAGQIP